MVRQPAELVLTAKDGTKTTLFRILEIQLNVLEIIQVEFSSKGIFYDGIWFPDWDTYLAKVIHESFLFAGFNTVWIDESGKGDSVDINLDTTKSFEVKQVLMKNDYWEYQERSKAQYSETFQQKRLEKKVKLV